jgi:hypothetical protein
MDFKRDHMPDHLLRRFLILVSICIMTSMFLVGASSGAATPGQTKRNTTYTDKIVLHKYISKAVVNGAGLDDVKQIFINRVRIEKSFLGFKSFFSSESEITFDKVSYKEPIALSTVLKDIKSDLWINSGDNSELISSFATLIDENEKTNPFDKLEPSQKVHFEIIKDKLGSNYAEAQESINRIIDEMENKSNLINKYFSEATLSYRLSLAAFVLSIFSIMPQLIALVRRRIGNRDL